MPEPDVHTLKIYPEMVGKRAMVVWMMGSATLAIPIESPINRLTTATFRPMPTPSLSMGEGGEVAACFMASISASSSGVAEANQVFRVERLCSPAMDDVLN